MPTELRIKDKKQGVAAARRVDVCTDLRLGEWLTDHRLVNLCVHVFSSSWSYFHVGRYQAVLLRDSKSNHEINFTSDDEIISTPSVDVNFQIKSMLNLSEREKVRNIMRRRKFRKFTLSLSVDGFN